MQCYTNVVLAITVCLSVCPSHGGIVAKQNQAGMPQRF